jgi:hypothetical protein
MSRKKRDESRPAKLAMAGFNAAALEDQNDEESELALLARSTVTVGQLIDALSNLPRAYPVLLSNEHSEYADCIELPIVGVIGVTDKDGDAIKVKVAMLENSYPSFVLKYGTRFALDADVCEEEEGN